MRITAAPTILSLIVAAIGLTTTTLSSLFQIAQAFQNPAGQNNTSTSPQTPCPYGLPRQNNGVCPIIPER